MPRSAGAGTVASHLALGPRAAAELAGVEHERRSRVQAAQAITSGPDTNRSARIVSVERATGQNGRVRLPVGARAASAVGQPQSRAARGRTRAPGRDVAAERRDLLDQARARRTTSAGLVGTKTVSTPVRCEFICAICSS